MASRFRRSHAFRLASEPFSLLTEDGIRLVGVRLGRGDPAVVLCHGFMGWHRKPAVGRLAEGLASRISVYTFDHRGHGASGGVCTFGDREILDVDAAVLRARADGHARVVTVGASMGGVAVLRHAALIGGVDGVVAISAPARWEGHGTAAFRRMTWLTRSRGGRRVARILGLRLSGIWDQPESPAEVIGKIAPTPLVLVHGHDDHFFDVEEAWALYRKAGEPRKLLLAGRFGHAEDGFTEAFADRLSREIAAMGAPA
jgi:pimeloyl-ACP methyl ester carboxylesterase